MCLCITKRQFKRGPLTAKKDIKVWKRFETIHTSQCYYVDILKVYETFYLRSPFQGFQYELGKTYTSILGCRNILDPAVGVYEGSHAYIKKSEAEYRKHSCEIIIQCVIPKGQSIIKIKIMRLFQTHCPSQNHSHMRVMSISLVSDPRFFCKY